MNWATDPAETAASYERVSSDELPPEAQRSIRRFEADEAMLRDLGESSAADKLAEGRRLITEAWTSAAIARAARRARTQPAPLVPPTQPPAEPVTPEEQQRRETIALAPVYALMRQIAARIQADAEHNEP
jgi:hypothetical protein